MGGRLAYIGDATTNAAIVSLMNAAGVDNVWVGLNDKGSEGTYHWVREDSSLSEITLMPGDYENWGTGEPSQSSNFLDCVHLVASTTKWHTRTCSQTKASVCQGVAPPPSPPVPPTPPPPVSNFDCFGDEQLNTAIASDAISQHSTDTAALDACIAAGSGSCGGIVYNSGVAASIQWSARQTGSIFTMQGVSFWAFTGCRRRRQLTQEEVEESDPVYQASLPSDAWWKDAYVAWAHANAAPALPPYSRRLAEVVPALDEADMSEPEPEPPVAAPDLGEDHHGPWARPKAGPLLSMRLTGPANADDRM